MKKDILILGLGNDILSDDGIGPRLVRDLDQVNQNLSVRFDVAGCGGLEILEYIKGFKKVVFIDAIRTRNGKPGDVYYFVPSDFRETLHLSNLHDIYFLNALKLGNVLELDLPVDLHIIAVEIVEDMEFSEELTPPLRVKYSEIFKEVHELLSKLIN